MIRIGEWMNVFFLISAHPDSPGQRAVKRLLLLLLFVNAEILNSMCWVRPTGNRQFHNAAYWIGGHRWRSEAECTAASLHVNNGRRQSDVTSVVSMPAAACAVFSTCDPETANTISTILLLNYYSLWALYTTTGVSRHSKLRTGGFCWKFYCLHALTDGN